MRVSTIVASLFLIFSQSSSQQIAPVVQRDPQAVALLQTSVSAMGGAVPADSVATGSVTMVAGSQTSIGTIRILTRGTNQSSEQITLPQSTYSVTYSAGLADESINSAAPASIPFERTVTSQSVCFPLPFLAAALGNPDESIQYVALETVGQQSLQHLHIQNTFASQPDFQQFAGFATFDLWLDANTGLPDRISFIRRNGSGATPRIPMDAYFSAYKSTSGVAYPTQINLSLNGTPWTTITINSVAFNTGLTDSNFSVQ
jgi:hypothetical protein